MLATLGALSCDRTPAEVASPSSSLGSSPGASSRTSTEVKPAATTITTEPSTVPPKPGASADSWNLTQVDWQPFDTGLRRAHEQNKPVCLVLYTTWCPHCRNYSHVFDDPRIVERARDFVMVRVDADAQSDIASKYAPDGGYIPRTFFLGPDGQLDANAHRPRARYQYFYDEREPSSLLAAMDTEHQKFVR